MSLDVDVLKAMVGAAKADPRRLCEALDETGARCEDLESAELRPLWACLEDRARKHQPHDMAAILEAVRLRAAGIMPTAVEVLNRPSMGTAHERLTLLREASIRRQLVVGLREVAVAAQSGEPLTQVRQRLDAVAPLMDGVRGRVRNCAGDSLAILESLMDTWAKNTPPRIQTGFPGLDACLGGLINNLTVVGARSGVGKSALVAGLVRNITGKGVKVGVLCYEDDARDMQARIIAANGDVSVRHVRGDLLPNLTQQQWIHDSIERWSNIESLLEVDDARPSGSPGDVLASMRSMVARGCRVIILDNMTCVRLDGGEQRHDLVVEAALRDIRGEAQRLRVPVVVVGHLKRGMGETDDTQKPPRLSDFSNSSAWENYARVALGMWREGGATRLRVLKQTNGPAGDDFEVTMNREAAVAVSVEPMQTRDAGPTEENPKPQRYVRGSRE